MTRAVRTPGELKALKAQEGFGAMLAARVGGALVLRVMIVGTLGVNVKRASCSPMRRGRLLGRENPWRAEPQGR
jgi:hypothetical protein